MHVICMIIEERKEKKRKGENENESHYSKITTLICDSIFKLKLKYVKLK